jgi:uncharacterized glyoxalase superfamily protein PhnB
MEGPASDSDALVRDVGRSADWIAEAFGFTETGRWSDDDGRVTHVNMELGGGVFMLGWPSADYQSPCTTRRRASRHGVGRRRSTSSTA